MTQQKSEDRIVPEAPGNRGQTRNTRMSGGGKAVPVKEEGRQQKLNFATAENPRKRGAEDRRDMDRSISRLQKVQKAKGKLKRVGPARLSHNPAVDRGLRNAYFAERGLVSLLDRFRKIWATINAPAQLGLPLGTARP